MLHGRSSAAIARTRLAALVILLVPLASAEPARAQIGLGNLLNAGKDVAIQQALSAFGKSIGAQLPIVVDNSDGFPTVAALPGAPFAPSPVPPVASSLRLSRDGTVGLPAGDYAFPVDVFCMRAHSGSPTGYRYVVAPLHGSAADIITALDARIPSYHIDHHVLQVLSWDIQAGMAYDAMANVQRAAADAVIPDFRSRLNGDVYQRIHDQYTRVTQNVPGMPSFEDALSRLGPVGTSVVALQALRQQLAQPPPTFEALARALVPALPDTGRGSAVMASATATPWSRYSSRVYVRFVTAGNYATPGTYQVRVLPAEPVAERVEGGARSALVTFARYVSDTVATGVASLAVANVADVPFSNIVNNPGTDSVQPLTIAPEPGLSAPAPMPSPTPTPVISSLTVAETPADRRRTIVGVGEEVHLTFSGGQASWDIQRSGSDGYLNAKLGSNIMYYAASKQATETITAIGAHDEKASITFDVIPPSDVFQRKDSATPLIHQQYTPSIGFRSNSYIRPATVSFQFIKVRELDACGVATGVFAPTDGTKPSGHHPEKKPTQVEAEVGDLGSVLSVLDTNYSGTPNGLLYHGGIGMLHVKFEPGFLEWEIPWVYSLTRGSDEHQFKVVEAKFTLAGDSSSLTATKAGATSTDTVDSESVGPAGVPLDPNAFDPCQTAK